MERQGSQQAVPNQLAAGRKEPRSGEHAIDFEPRIRLFAQVDLHSESNFFSGFSGTLLDGGLFVATYAALTLGQRVLLEFSLPGGHFVSVHGHVAWLREPRASDRDLPPGAGIVMDALDEDARRAVGRFMTLREPNFVDRE